MKIRREDTLEYNHLERFFSEVHDMEKAHLLITDGIVIDYADYMDKESMDKVYVQRILTPYQLEKILMGSDNNPHMIILRSEVLETWSASALQSIQDILSIKSGFYGCHVELCIVGRPGMYQMYLGKKSHSPVDVRSIEDEVPWAEAPLP
ncbi:MAG: hypothetical protein M1162_04755 [Candidatus Thermoplasmatota archaeon]|nr:hypothetical protein [Candidatus Thermoplasmatota archaeon]